MKKSKDKTLYKVVGFRLTKEQFLELEKHLKFFGKTKSEAVRNLVKKSVSRIIRKEGLKK